MTLQDIVARFNTTPFLFAGSGITRRYYGLPDWAGLLREFTGRINPDRFAYNAYENEAQATGYTQGLLPKVATLIQNDFDAKWYASPEIRTLTEPELALVEGGISPFKVEISSFLSRKSSILSEYKAEVEKLKNISKSNLAGIITTNYDLFFENLFDDYTSFVGQDELVFSSIQGIAEIYKIHGSISQPSTLIITEKDYERFSEKSKYLAAKLMTIFMEYPIIFIGYSLTDINIQSILENIVICLPEDKFATLQERFVFIEYDQAAQVEQVSFHTIMINGKPLAMSKVTTANFLPIYEAIEMKQAKLPVRILRRFKQELYSFVITSTPTAMIRVASIEDPRVSDEELVLAIGRADQLGIHGLNGITGNDWYQNIVLDDLLFTADELLEHAFPVLIRQNSNRLPVNKYLSQATGTYPECVELAERLSLDEIIPDTILKHRGTGEYHSIKEIWAHEKGKLERATRLISQLNVEELNVEELESVLRELFSIDNYLESISSADRSQVRRLILMYDLLKWGDKRKELPD